MLAAEGSSGRERLASAPPGARATLALGLLTAIGLSAAQLAIPVVLGSIVDHALLARDASALLRLCGTLVALAAATSVCQVLHDLNFARRGETALIGLQKDGLRKLLVLPTLEIERQRSGRLHSLLVQDAPAVASLHGTFLGQSLLAACQLLGVVAILLSRFGAVSLLAVLLIPAYLVVPWLMTGRIRETSRALSAARAEVSSMLQESIQATADIRVFGRESWAIERLEPSLRQRLQRRIAYVLASSSEWVNYTLAFLVGAAVYWFGGRQVLADQMSVGQLVTLVAILGYLEGPVGRATRLWGELQAARASRERLGAILDAQPARRVVDGSAMPRGPVGVRFRNVTFRYGPGLPAALDGVTFVAEPGAMVGVVGPSGAGKSTLAKLLLRLYGAEGGVIEVAGRSIDEYEETSFRKALGFIPQDPVLFPGTVAENIHLGRSAGGRDDVELAARLANAHHFVTALPAGYDTAIGDRGVGLSGGQKQRLAIARAVFGDPGLLVLDEATSALDSEAERAVREALRAARRERTTFVITHRLATIRECDLILVLDRGRLVACGAHGEIAGDCDVYSRLAAAAP